MRLNAIMTIKTSSAQMQYDLNEMLVLSCMILVQVISPKNPCTVSMWIWRFDQSWSWILFGCRECFECTTEWMSFSLTVSTKCSVWINTKRSCAKPRISWRTMMRFVLKLLISRTLAIQVWVSIYLAFWIEVGPLAYGKPIWLQILNSEEDNNIYYGNVLGAKVSSSLSLQSDSSIAIWTSRDGINSVNTGISMICCSTHVNTEKTTQQTDHSLG